MRVHDLMKTDVQTVGPDASLKDVAARLVEHGISGMPVCDEDGFVLGVISEGDILHKEHGRVERRGGPLAWLLDPAKYADVSKAEARTAGEAMTAPALTITPGRTAGAAARLMVEKAVNRLPVVTRDGKLVGIVSRADLVRAFTRSDDEIAAEVRTDVLGLALWLEPDAVELTVLDGEVQLAGELETSTDVRVLEKLVESIPGVVSVDSHVGYRVHDSDRAGRFAGYR